MVQKQEGRGIGARFYDAESKGRREGALAVPALCISVDVLCVEYVNTREFCS